MLGEKYAKISGQKLEDNQGICIVPKYKYLLLRYSFITKGIIRKLTGVT